MEKESATRQFGLRGASSVPHTLEGYAILHQFFHIKRRQWARRPRNERAEIVARSASMFTSMAQRDDGQSALFCELGHKADLVLIHFRRTFDELAEVKRTLDQSELREFLEISGSYLSVVEVGLYEATVQLNSMLAARGLTPESPQWR